MGKSRPALRAIAGLWVLLVALYLVGEHAQGWATPWLVLTTVLLALPLTLLLFRRRRLRREAFRRMYLHADSGLQRRLRGGVLMLAGCALLALVFAALLLAGLVRVDAPLWWPVLALVVPAWVGTHGWIDRRLAPHAGIRFRRTLSDRANAFVWGVLLLVWLVVLGLFESVPRLDGASIEAAVLAYTDDVQAASPWLQGALEAMAALDGVRHWLAQHLGPQLASVPARTAVWGLVLVREWLLVWPLLLLFQAVHATLDGELGRLADGDAG